MIKKYLPLFIFFFTFNLFAQNIVVLGTVLDESNKPVAFSNVVLTEQTSLQSIGTTTDDLGKFEFEFLKGGEYILNISYLGFETYSKVFALNGTIDLGNIILLEKSEVLEGVTIVAKRPTIKRLIDRTVFNVENSTVSNYNVLEVLKYTPGVLVSDGKITVKNSNPVIYLNDRRVYLSNDEVQQLLEGTSAQNVKSIEVITSPPAKYDAEGGAVINIVTSKNIVAGYNGSVFGNYKQGFEYPKYSAGTSHFFKTNKLNTYFHYNVSPRKDFRHNREYVNFKDDNNVNNSIWETDFKRTSETANHNFVTNIDYDLNENNVISFSGNLLLGPEQNSNKHINSVTEMFNANYDLDSLFKTRNDIILNTRNLALNVDFVHDFKKEGEKLIVKAHHTNYNHSNVQDVTSDYFLPNETNAFRSNIFQTDSEQKAQLYTGQLDYELPLNNGVFVETGVKYSDITSNSEINQFVLSGNVGNNQIEESDTFVYNEMNYAAYGSLAQDWEKWSVKAGLRVEHSRISGELLLQNSENTTEYTKFFPSFYLTNDINENNQVYFKYVKRINRPKYNDLNPFRYYLNDNTYVVGNPKLKPQIDDVFNLGYTLKNTYTFELFYRYENDPSLQLFQQDNEEGVVKYSSTNIARNITYGLDFMTYTALSSRWNLYVLSSVFYYEGKFFSPSDMNVLNSNEKWSIYAQVINYFSFLKDNSLTAEVSYMYISPIVDGPAIYSTRQGLDINFKKALWNNRASVNIGVTDVFNTQNFTETNRYADQDLRLESNMENRLFVVGFNYKFGNYKLSNNKKEIEIDERERLENDSRR
ncbi:TonB-dependent receptor [Aestuariibaculum sp. TT11]|uniref:TonB-dependent receptor n=2 Tax=Aestuariibaculum sediminum TaxID=2770637 RepID=A0A8J6Q8W5_9FLAO|nr:TonB-dependent receptor [Aestuariibaculum sediminum]